MNMILDNHKINRKLKRYWDNYISKAQEQDLKELQEDHVYGEVLEDRLLELKQEK